MKKDDLELMTLLTPPPKCWNDVQVLPHPANLLLKFHLLTPLHVKMDARRIKLLTFKALENKPYPHTATSPVTFIKHFSKKQH